jgi:SAM-dependent methyltransferase
MKAAQNDSAKLTEPGLYTPEFYASGLEGSRASAEEILPLVLTLVQPSSIVDVGCGVGTWLAVAQGLGVTDVLGLDGDHVHREMLQIPDELFVACDLERSFTLQRCFDLAISMEVAEHLSPECAGAFVSSLCCLAPVILFSAAIPFQRGTGHKNEQWPDYWASLFLERGFEPVDAIRRRVWRNPRVEWWYAQNTLIFATRATLKKRESLKCEQTRTSTEQLAIVHPLNYLRFPIAASQLGFRQSLRTTGALLLKSIKRRVFRSPGMATQRSVLGPVAPSPERTQPFE